MNKFFSIIVLFILTFFPLCFLAGHLVFLLFKVFVDASQDLLFILLNTILSLVLLVLYFTAYLPWLLDDNYNNGKNKHDKENTDHDGNKKSPKIGEVMAK